MSIRIFLLLSFFFLSLISGGLGASEKSLVAYWTMDEIRKGVIADKSGNGSNARVVGGLTLADSPNGKAAFFDGSGRSYLVVDFSKALDGLTDFTIEYMVNYRNLFALENNGNNYPTIINRGDYNKEYPSFWLFVGFHSQNKTNYCRITNWFKKSKNLNVQSCSSNKLEWEKNKWYYVKVAVDAKNQKIKYYRDGQVVGEGRIPANYDFSSGKIYIGSNKGNKNVGMMDGFIDEVKIYDNSLIPKTSSIIDAQKILPDVLIIDGDISDKVWQSATEGNFIRSRQGVRLRKPGKVSFLYDKDNLYIGIRFTELELKSLKAMHKKHDAALWQDDCAEIFIGKVDTPKSFYHFIFNSLGIRFDEDVLNATDHMLEWNPDWRVAVKKGDNFWSAEAVIPFKSIGIEKAPEEGSSLKISVNREEQNIPENSGWPNGVFHKPEKFGTIIFGTYKNAIMRKIKILKRIEHDIMAQLEKMSDSVLVAKAENMLAEAQKKLLSVEKEVNARSGNISVQEWYISNKELDILKNQLLSQKFEVKGNVLLHELKEVQKTLDEKQKRYFQKEMLNLEKECRMVITSSSEMRAIYNKLRNQYWQKLFDRPYLCWKKSPWTNLPSTQFPDISDKECSFIKMNMGMNEYEQDAFAITNFTDHEMKIHAEISDSDKLKVKLREAYLVRIENGELLNDPLPLLETMTIPPLQSREIWVVADSSQAPAGNYDVNLKIIPQNMPESKILLNVKVYPVEFPREPQDIPVYSFVWDYIESETAKQDLLLHHINVPYIGLRNLPLPVFEKDGSMKVDYSRLDKVLDLWKKDFKIIGIYWGLMRKGYADMRIRFGPENEYMTATWKKRFSMWYKQLIKHLAEKGLGYDDFFFHTFDETTKPATAKFFAYLKELDPNVKLFLNPCGTNSRSTDEIMACNSYVDIWCPWFNASEVKITDLNIMKSKGKLFWFYYNPRVRNYRLASPYGGYRLCGWKSWKNGSSGCGMWVYSISGGEKEQWWHKDKYKANHQPVIWDMVYNSRFAPPDVSRKELIIPSKRWEGWREGIEDYCYLAMLNDAVQKFKIYDDNGRKNLRHAKEILEKYPNEVCRQFFNDALANQAKREILEAICNLKGVK
jgi:hypothetical protein